MIAFLKLIFMVSYILKLRECDTNPLTGSLTEEATASIEYSEDMLLEKVIAPPLNNHKKFRGKISKR